MTTWRQEILDEMEAHGESWENVISCTLSGDGLDLEFYGGYGRESGQPFTAWTRRRVYFPACYDGKEWCASVSRKLDGKPTEHIGG